MKIVLDSNIFISEYRLANEPFILLLVSTLITNDILCIPEVVIDETVNKYKEDLNTNLDSLNKTLINLKYMLGRPIKNPLNQKDISELVDEYKLYLIGKLEKYNFHTIPYPDVPHKELVHRSLERKKPYDDKGRKGYRDHLIWLSIINLLEEENNTVAFVTNNVSDFFSGDGLHADLKDDLKKRGISSDRFSIYKTLKQFNEAVLFPRLKSIEEEALEEIKNSEQFDIPSFITEVLIVSPPNIENIASFATDISPFCRHSAYLGLQSIEEVNLLKAEQLGEMVRVIVTAVINLLITVTLHESDWERCPQVLSIIGIDSKEDLKDKMTISFTIPTTILLKLAVITEKNGKIIAGSIDKISFPDSDKIK